MVGTVVVLPGGNFGDGGGFQGSGSPGSGNQGTSVTP